MTPSDLKYGEALCTLMHTPVPTGIQGTALSEGWLQDKVPCHLQGPALQCSGHCVQLSLCSLPGGREGCVPFMRLLRWMLNPLLS